MITFHESGFDEDELEDLLVVEVGEDGGKVGVAASNPALDDT